MGFIFNSPEKSSEYITVKAAAEISGYNQQYLRRLLRENVLQSIKLGQLWLIDHGDFIRYLTYARQSKDNRYGPQ